MPKAPSVSHNRMGLYDTIVMPDDGGSFQTKSTANPHFATYHIGDRIDCADGVHSETYDSPVAYWFQVHHGRLLFAARQPPPFFNERLPWDAPGRYVFDPTAEALHRLFMCIATDEFGTVSEPLKEFGQSVASETLQNFLHETGQDHVLPDGFEPKR